MKNFEVYFELFGKKMKTTVLARDKDDAKESVQNSITFYKVEEKLKDVFNDCIDMLDSMNDMLKKR